MANSKHKPSGRNPVPAPPANTFLQLSSILDSQSSLGALRQWDAELTGKIAEASKRRRPGMVARLGLVRSDIQKRIAVATVAQMRCA